MMRRACPLEPFTQGTSKEPLDRETRGWFALLSDGGAYIGGIERAPHEVRQHPVVPLVVDVGGLQEAGRAASDHLPADRWPWVAMILAGGTFGFGTAQR
jgi:hypothetical protein